tara:strand:- start:2940 stop:4586 length:1647 start_codon:yes stop_codon:yes gene_type:complete
MRKKRILFCSEATFLNTGYATYTREILKYLHSTGKYEIAELGAYGTDKDPRAASIPWKFYGVMPDESDKQNMDKYNSSPIMQFGEFKFESVCLDFMPDIVCDIRDFWMVEFIERSPYRHLFKWCLMPTVDASPQARQWLATYQSADACLTYSDWSGEVLKKQSGNKINYIGTAPPSAHQAYRPIEDKEGLRKKYGIPVDAKVIGTVMRNQRRKLYPDLFAAFRKMLDSVKDPHNYFLYCHTSYPDMGWNIPELLNEYGLSSHVFMTYICPQTRQPFASMFRGAVRQSPFTGTLSATVSSVKNGATYEQLSEIINLFDLYVQYANSEGFGLPQVEAAACGVPVMSTDYSAMESVIRQLGGTPLKVKSLYKELETGCNRAVPDNDFAAKAFQEFFEIPKPMRMKKGFEARGKFLEHFTWKKSGSAWENYFDSVEISEQNQWVGPPNIKQPAPKPPEKPNAPSSQIAKWLISEVLCDPSKLSTYMEARLTKDLTYGSTTSSTAGMYFNESSAAFDGRQNMSHFDFNIAYQEMLNMRNRINFWEQKRAEVCR